jgi:xanthine dehydrogenase small subunit
MNQRIFFNTGWVSPTTAHGSPALDFIRGEMGLTGTKEGCREGDCGACAILVGEFSQGSIRYDAVPSCLLATGDLYGKHCITIEGLSTDRQDGLSRVQSAFLETNASQCGFCTPGFIIALSSWLCQPGTPDLAGAMIAVDGNLCRCTGYGAIRRAAELLVKECANLPTDRKERLKALVSFGVLPSSVLTFMQEQTALAEESAHTQSTMAEELTEQAPEQSTLAPAQNRRFIGGGTDFYVRNPEPDTSFNPIRLRSFKGLQDIHIRSDGDAFWAEIGAAATIRDFFASSIVREAVPGIEKFEREFASTLIRNLATVGGNIANASPVGDLTAMFMAIGAKLRLGAPQSPVETQRLLPLEDFFLGYKTIDLKPDEAILSVLLPYRTPEQADRENSSLHFSFAKVAKRKNLDIAAVNTGLSCIVRDGTIVHARISAGGVAPTPILLPTAAKRMEGVSNIWTESGKSLATLAFSVAEVAENEVSPISDVRGSGSYRKSMIGRLVIANFMRIFDSYGIARELFS